MKQTYTTVAIACLLGAALTFSGCKEKTEPNQEPEASSPNWREMQEVPGAMPLPGDAPFVAASLAWDVPAEWEYRESGPGVRKAEFVIGGPGGEAELVFFHFGPGQGGSVEANLDRWARAVLDENGEPVHPEIIVVEDAPMPTVAATYAGTYLSGPPMGERTPINDSVLLGGVVEGGPEGTVFLRLVGPAETVGPLRDQWLTMLRSVRSAGG